jgi:hypothetical protein
MAQVCLIRADGPTGDIQHDFNGWAAKTLGEIHALHSLTTEYKGIYARVPGTLAGEVKRSDTIIFYGHGQWDLLEVRDSSGAFSQWFVSSPASPAISAASLSGKIIVAIACQAGHKFGPDVIALGAKAFIGFSASVAYIPTPGLTPASTHFMDGFTGGASKVLEGLAKGSSAATIAADAKSEIRDLFQQAHDYFKFDKKGAAHPNAVRARVWAAWNRDHAFGL